MNKALRSRKALWGIVDNLRSHTGGTLKKIGEPQAAVRWWLNLRLAYILFVGSDNAVVIQ